MSASIPLTCVVADDHPSVLEVVCEVLGAGGVTVVARAGDGEEALAKIVQHRPEVAVVDVLMPGLTGIEVTRRAAAAAPATAIVLYTGYGDAAMLSESLDAGARGFVLKESPLEDLLRAVEVVSGGQQYVDPLLAGTLVLAAGTKLPKLTQRERDVLALLADGLSNDEMGIRLGISAETVRTHIRKAMSKLGVESRTQAVATALRLHLIS
jgi:DNA-binding NarL/FixJ family response regulator